MPSKALFWNFNRNLRISAYTCINVYMPAIVIYFTFSTFCNCVIRWSLSFMKPTKENKQRRCVYEHCKLIGRTRCFKSDFGMCLKCCVTSHQIQLYEAYKNNSIYINISFAVYKSILNNLIIDIIVFRLCFNKQIPQKQTYACKIRTNNYISLRIKLLNHPPNTKKKFTPSAIKFTCEE